MDKLATIIRSDGDFKGGIITVVGTCVTLSPYIALGMGCPVPDDVVWTIRFAGYIMLFSGVAISFGYAWAVISRRKSAFNADKKTTVESRSTKNDLNGNA